MKVGILQNNAGRNNWRLSSYVGKLITGKWDETHH